MRYLGKINGVDRFECLVSEVNKLPKKIFIANKGVHAKPANHSIAVTDTGDKYTFNGTKWVNSAVSSDDDIAVKSITVPKNGLMVASSTADSKKVFAITVTDDGEITAVEV